MLAGGNMPIKCADNSPPAAFSLSSLSLPWSPCPHKEVPFPGSAPSANRTPCRILSSADNLDAQEQWIYQLQTKQRERQADLEQKCSQSSSSARTWGPATSYGRELGAGSQGEQEGIGLPDLQYLRS
ncbi:uncharacterized protein LOC128793409 isoform X9 [Vidua chalybeata]|uniref:uncharacterized protein LOC128793409 isoform X9 n=1 Tax=Vidua chalybeata TaxID=81927 RepID=UPI0023A838C6|nr:uncharacterized protein LOC128793409 isoform X9 [Vidua chalybeata]